MKKVMGMSEATSSYAFVEQLTLMPFFYAFFNTFLLIKYFLGKIEIQFLVFLC